MPTALGGGVTGFMPLHHLEPDVSEADDVERTDDTRSSRTEPGDDGEAEADPGGSDSEDRVPEPVEPGSPSLENAAFVALGVASMIALVAHLLSLL